MRLFLHLARRAAVAFGASLAAIVLLFLVVDFAENASLFSGPGWLAAAAALYANRAAVVACQTAPAAMLFAAAVTGSDLQRSREYVALRSLGLGPWRVAVPVLAIAALVAVAGAWIHDAIAVEAASRADEILATRFHRASALRGAHDRQRWFRGREGRRIYHLRAGEAGAFERVTILEVTDEFRLARRIDAARMNPGADAGEWILDDVSERSFAPDGSVTLTSAPRRAYRFDEDPGAFAVRPGRPAQMRRAALREQMALRERLGLPARDFALEAQARIAQPLAAIPAALLALAVALRRGRKGHVTAALVESVAISVAFWAVQAACWSLGASGHVAPAIAAWTPDALLLAAGAVAIRRYA